MKLNNGNLLQKFQLTLSVVDGTWEQESR